jgi:hypothetical protein
VNPYLKILLGVIGAVDIVLPAAFGESGWVIVAQAAITAALTAAHVVPAPAIKGAGGGS